VRRKFRQWTLFVAATAIGACESPRVGGPLGSGGTGGTGGTGTTTGPSAPGLVGTWRRILYFIAADGSTGSNETTWRFDANGTASRVTVTRNFTSGQFDSQVVDARWEPLTQALRITFLPPSSGTFEFAYRITADTLYLASQPYGRLSR
jgi:hypothetical protein